MKMLVQMTHDPALSASMLIDALNARSRADLERESRFALWRECATTTAIFS
jgi:hypothetical protein